MNVHQLSVSRGLLDDVDGRANIRQRGRGKVPRLELVLNNPEFRIEVLLPPELVAQIDGDFHMLVSRQGLDDGLGRERPEYHKVINPGPPNTRKRNKERNKIIRNAISLENSQAHSPPP